MEYKAILRKYWGYEDFRGIQRDIIESIGNGHDTLGLMPTGGGKSITFQVPALAMEGVCIVITPLISLMKDQVDHLRRLSIPAYALSSENTHSEQVKILDNCIFGDIKFLYVSPERLSSPFFITKLRHIKVSFITVDEAHCISQWGYDFRPAYLEIAKIRKVLPVCPVLALTATATPDVVDDIQYRLDFKEKRVFSMSFRRKNLTYIVRKTADIIQETIHILERVEGSAIIYASSRRKTKELNKILNSKGISATYYHAGLDMAVKTSHQNEWQQGSKRVIVATNAFGMGIDKPDVRLVIHADVPSSLEAYFQEAGRAGRDGKRAYAVLLTMKTTHAVLKKRIVQTFPEKDVIRDIYEHIAYYYEIGVGMGKGHTFIFPLDKFCVTYKYSPFVVDAALHILNNAGYIHYQTDPDDRTRLKFTLGRDELYSLRDVSQEEDNLILTIMRLYPGVFSDFKFISEKALARLLSSTPERIYMLLTNLRRKGIINFVPPRTEPKLTYLIDRVDGKDVKITKEVYDDLRDVMARHVESVIGYIDNTEECRQLQLVRYFGEKSFEDCGTCEVCLEKKRRGMLKTTKPGSADAECKKYILRLLSDGKRHTVGELSTLSVNKTVLSKVLSEMIENEEIISDSIYIRMPTNVKDS
ncbi:MAG: ATP-dependent DNA helicase RecQ [Prevotella sp.]